MSRCQMCVNRKYTEVGLVFVLETVMNIHEKEFQGPKTKRIITNEKNILFFFEVEASFLERK